MKDSLVRLSIILALVLAVREFGHSQFIEDALRLSFPGSSVGARSLGMGTAAVGLANDFSASYWNPAGLGQMNLNEASFGFSNLSYGNTSTFYGSSRSLSNNSTNLNSVGLVYCVPTARGSLVFSLGYGQQADFTTGLSFNGFNPKSSIIQTWAPNGASIDDPRYADLANNIAYQLFLANVDTISRTFVSLINDSLTQSGTVLEGGGLNYYSLSGAVEAAPNVYLGVTMDFISGSYSLTRNFSEADLLNVYNAGRFPFDFTSLSISEAVKSDVGGFTAKLGFLYKIGTMTRLGITVKTPSWVRVRESFSIKTTSMFDNGNSYNFPSTEVLDKNEYDVRTPFIFSFGLAHSVQNLTLAGDIEYSDWTQTEFTHDDAATSFNLYLNELNSLIKSQLEATTNFRLGAEYTIPDAGVSLRGGYAYIPSPYKFDSSPNAQKYITGGIGFTIESSFIINLAYARGTWETSHINYSHTDLAGQQLSQTQEKITTNNVIGTISYRF